MIEPPLVASPEPSESGRVRRTTRVVIAVAAAVSLLVASSIALLLVLRYQHAERDDLAQARESAAAAAGRVLVNLDALSAPTIDADMKRVVDGATGTFKRQFTGSQKELKAYIVKQKSTSKGNLRSVAVVRSDLDTATVLVAIDRTFKDAANPNGVVANDRWKVSLERHGGKWLAAELEPVA